ncbi:MAG: YeeE/YedE family protein [Gammaproteobacteria bacterium]|nr:YeeE/YedE family protein [Gammaproteobacteria bacterium]
MKSTGVNSPDANSPDANSPTVKTAAGYIAGLLFGLGLAISGMTDPARVLGFLDVAGAWDPTLMFVLGSAVGTTFVGYRLVFARGEPLFSTNFQLPTKQALDGKLLGGAALFGIGWGLSGYCPGPAIASIGGISLPLLALLVAMVAGWFIAKRISS